ncbi:MAG: tandem-95 repeat protein [Verrucomicrobia bacterium]|nr:tandem-95 repeat protein [Verrucomicrobiota bacterium]
MNDAPSFVKGADQTVLEDAGKQTVTDWPAGLSAGPSDEAGRALTFQVSNSNAALFSTPPAISSTGTLTYTPATHANGSATVTVSLQDNGGTANGGLDSSAVQTFTITVTAVNDAPTLAAISDQTILEDAGQQNIVLSGNSTGAANESQTLTVTVTDSGGTANGGVEAISRSFVASVTPVNDPPTLASLSDLTIEEDAINQYGVSLIGIGAGSPNESQSLRVFMSVSNPELLADLSLGYVSPNPSGGITFRPAPNAHGTAVVSVTVQDDGGVSNGGADSVSRSFEVRVIPVNDPPHLTRINQLMGAVEDTEFAITHTNLAAATDANDVDRDVILFRIENVLAGTLSKGGTPFQPGLTVLAPGETLLWKPPANANGEISGFAARAFDGKAVSASAVGVRIQVAGQNDPPVLAAISDQNIAEDGMLLLDVAIDDAETAAKDLIVSAESSNTNLVSRDHILFGGLGKARRMIIVPTADQNGTATLTVTVTDGDGLSTSRIFTLTVQPANDAPTLTSVNTLVGARKDTAFTISYATLALAANEMDVDGDLVSFRIEVVSTGTLTKGGSLVTAGTTLLAQGKTLVWTPSSNGVATAFKVKADDGLGVSVAISEQTAVIGAFVADLSGKTDAGAAYIFSQIGTNWTEQSKLTASRGAAFDRFGSSVAVSGDTVVIEDAEA